MNLWMMWFSRRIKAWVFLSMGWPVINQSMVLGFLHSHSIVSEKNIWNGWQQTIICTIYHHLSPVHFFWFPKNGLLINRMTIYPHCARVSSPIYHGLYPQDVSSLFCSEFVAEVLQRGVRRLVLLGLLQGDFVFLPRWTPETWFNSWRYIGS